MGFVDVILIIFKKSYAHTEARTVYYTLFVMAPVHIIPIVFWVLLYFFYGAIVNSSFDDLTEEYNELGNILDSVNCAIFKSQNFPAIKVRSVF